jgi:putative phage-type endonuclease
VSGPILIPVDVGSDEWHARRREGVTASEIAGILGIAPDAWTSPFNLYWRKLGKLAEDRDTDSMAWGRDLEAAILARFAREHPELGVTVGALYSNGDHPWRMATPDGLAHARRRKAGGMPAVRRVGGYRGRLVAVVQVKTAHRDEEWGEAGTEEIPTYYLAQVRWEMHVTGVRRAYLPVLFDGRTYREYVVDQDDEDVALMVKEAEEFLRRIFDRDPPDVDWRASTTSALKELHPELEDREVEVDPQWREDYLAADAAIKAAEQEKALASNRILAAMGNAARAVVNGQKVASRSVFDLKERTLPATTVRRLYVNKPKKEKAKAS